MTADVLEAARRYRRAGLGVVPIAPHTKRPAVADWPRYDPSDDELARDFAEGAGVGLLLGARSGNLCDVDLDAAEARELAPEILPDTDRVSGRDSSPRSHYWYRSAIGETRQYRAPDGVMLVELRSEGGQTLAPPSLHPSGERIAWSREGAPARVEPDVLRRAVSRLAAAALLARAWPARGSRHDCALALAGALLRAGWTLEDAAHYVAAIARAAGDEEARARVADVISTAKRLAAERRASGLPTLTKLVGEAVVGRIAEWLELSRWPEAASASGAAAPAHRMPVLVRVSDVEREDVSWLWSPYIPAGKLTLLEGDPGLGKTWLALAIVAAVTRGRALPGPDGGTGAPQAAGSALYLTAEDGIGDTLRPRLEGAHADLARVVVLDGARDSAGETYEITLADVDVLGQALAAVRPTIVVVDPVQGYLGAGVDMHRANEVRPILAGLARLAQEYGCAVVAIRHLRKSSADRAVHRGLGSIDLAAAARSIVLVAEDPEDPARRIMAHVKSNLAPRGESLLYEIREEKIVWCGTSKLGADALLAASPSSERPRDAAAEWLSEMLASGPLPVARLRTEANAAGVAWRTLLRARDSIGARAVRVGGLGAAGSWKWLCPKDANSSMSASGILSAAERAARVSAPETATSGHLSERAPTGSNGRARRLPLDDVQGVSAWVDDRDPEARVWELRRGAEVLARTDIEGHAQARAWLDELRAGRLPPEVAP